jgi:hypothetical protein
LASANRFEPSRTSSTYGLRRRPFLVRRQQVAPRIGHVVHIKSRGREVELLGRERDAARLDVGRSRKVKPEPKYRRRPVACEDPRAAADRDLAPTSNTGKRSAFRSDAARCAPAAKKRLLGRGVVAELDLRLQEEARAARRPALGHR